MKRTLIVCLALMTLSLFACGGQPSGDVAAPAVPAEPGAPAAPGEPAAPGAPFVAAGAETNACVSQHSCREFTHAMGPMAWENSKMLCGNLGGTWQSGGCPTANVVATCERLEGGGKAKMFCYSEVMSCQIACQDGGNFQQM